MDSLHGLGNGADLVELDQDRVGASFGDAAGDEPDVGDVKIVADDLDPVSQEGGMLAETCPIVFSQPVFNGDDGILFYPGLPRLCLFGVPSSSIMRRSISAC